ncbi:hypothetical protein [Methylobacterium longum]|uniref:Uncharacterized protein n=1 Tax=Methylobacterium longum TaxID=767694 RepID=A0ABT8AQV3_9HYPH|nr:hypothetical protein [Methylobacterium longum]MDN3571805.1 hypothetical protein [Methylobacterium longum]GJE14006.1 hypothetical protein FOHLNKBM_5075 [Methylobacterium longum]
MSTQTGAVADFSAFLAVDQIPYEIMSLDGVTSTGWTWTISGPGHPKAVAHTNEQTKKSLRKARLVEQAQVNGKKYVAEERTAEDQRRDNLAWIASRVLGWSPMALPFITGDAEPIPFSDENVIKVLMHEKMGFVFTQLVDVVTEDKRFTQRSEPTSERTPSTTSA